MKVGDLVLMNEQFASYLKNPNRFMGIVGVIIYSDPEYEEYNVMFGESRIDGVPRHWLISLSIEDLPKNYCPIEEEWKLWGDQ